MNQDEIWMQKALNLAYEAGNANEVPVGAIIVIDNKVIGSGFNQPISQNDPSGHAEIIALREAAKNIGNYRLINAELYVTLEPCMMCVGAMVHARIKKLIFGAFDTKTGAVCSVANCFDLPFLNHKVSYQGGILSQQCGEILSNFFKSRR